MTASALDESVRPGHPSLRVVCRRRGPGSGVGTMQQKRRTIKNIFAWAICAALLGAYASPQAQQIRALPDEVMIRQGTQEQYLFDLPAGVALEPQSVQALGSTAQTLSDVGARGVSLIPLQVGQTSFTLSLWGKIPIKTITVSVYQEKTLVVGGSAIGMTLKTDGVLVVGMAGVSDGETTLQSPAQTAGIEPGDVILSVGDQAVDTVEQLQSALESAGQPAALTVRRAGKTMRFFVTPVISEEKPRLGIWARDSTAGIGTLTYYDPQTGVFGALGHPITDPDTGALLTVRDGSVYGADINGVRKGARGNPGQLEGTFGDTSSIGTLLLNTPYGVFGTLEQAPQGGQVYPVAGRGEITCGPAQILTTIDGSAVKAYDCEIERLFSQNTVSAKSMVVRITDPQLLDKTGGIVQGMSGSPILQNGKIVGAVTHVYVSDASRGYGIYIEWMLGAADQANAA